MNEKTNRRQQGKKAKLKMGVTRKQSTPNSPRKRTFLPPDTQTYV